MDTARRLFHRFDSWIERPRWKGEHPFDWSPRAVTEEELAGAVDRLDAWVTSKKWRGYDPFDLKSLALYRKTKWMPDDAGVGTKLLRYILYKGESVYPVQMRRLFLIKERMNPKGIGLFAHAYCLLARLYPDNTDYPAKGEECLDWLVRNRLRQYHGACWGYPFDWESIIPIPEDTPSAVVSTTVGAAFLEWYLYSGKEEYLEICRSICDFLLGDLYIDHASDDSLCFSYTPIDRYHVHNANLMAAAFLTRTGTILKNDELIDAARKAVNYTVKEQLADGSFFYWGPPSDRDYSLRKEQYELVDHLHTGYVLRALHSIYNITGDAEILESIQKGFSFYIEKLFENEFTPMRHLKSLYPVDIHFCAEAILSLTDLDDLFPGSRERATVVAAWLIEHFQDRDGFFYAAMRSNDFQRIPYMRWGQAWTLLAFSSLLGKMRGGSGQ
ncbi:hypothetical protein ACFL4G_02075 [Thermodesulfobacteriota bacterium]